MAASVTLIQQFAVQTQLLKVLPGFIHLEHFQSLPIRCEADNIIIEPRHEISNSVVRATIKGSDQPAHMRSLISAFASRLIIL